MNSKKQDKITRKDDTDSGLDNSSESGRSGDEDHPAINSDYEDLFNSDGESNTSNEESKSGKNSKTFLSKNSSDALTIPLDENEVPKTDVYVQFNNYERVEEEYQDVINFYQALVKGQNESVDFSITSQAKKPIWLDENKFKRGQKFARDHLFCINFAEMVTLFILFAQKSSLGPLIFTGKSDAPYTAFVRYLNTLSKLMSWYQNDVWSEEESLGKKNLGIVRGMHKNVYQKLTQSSEKELAEKTTLGDPNTTAIWCPLRNLLVEDFREFVKPPLINLNEYLNCKKVWINQADMSITQFGFVGLAVTFPEYFGIHAATDNDLDAFLHLWRGLGYLLGIKDEYNYCNSDLETVRRRTKFYLEVAAKPAFREVTCDWEHMCRCLTAGISFYLPQVNFESSLLYLCHMLKINTPRLKKQMSFRSYIIFQLHRLVFYLMRFPAVLNWLNSRLYEVIKNAQNASSEVLEKWENRKFSYMNQENKCPIRGQMSS